MRRLKVLLVAAVVALGFWGCDSVWLPDSSGILFVRNDDHTLVHYDLETNKESVVARYDWLSTDLVKTLPAIRPDGKQAALVRHVATPEGIKAQVLIHELSGRQVHASKEFDVPRSRKGKPKPEKGAGRAHWSRDGRRIVFFLMTECERDPQEKPDSLVQDTNDYAAGVYDIEAGTVKFHPKLIEIEEFGITGLSPLVPGERGFLASDNEETPDDDPAKGLFLVDWQGERHKFSATNRAIEDVKKSRARAAAEAAEGRQPEPRGGLVEEGSWNGPVASVRDDEGAVATFDCEKLVLDVKPGDANDPILKYAREKKVSVCPMGDGVLLQFREKPAPAPPPEGAAPKNTPCDVEVVRRVQQDGQWRWTTMAVARVESLDWLLPSPDRKHVLLYANRGERGRAHLIIVSREGKVVADLKRADPQPAEPPGPPEAPPVPPPAPPAPSSPPPAAPPAAPEAAAS